MSEKPKKNFKYELKNVGKRIREERERRCLTQFELAEVTGLSVSHISNIERGVKSEIGFLKICSIVKSLNMTLDDITTTDETPEEGLTLTLKEDVNAKAYSENKEILIGLISELEDVEIKFFIDVVHAFLPIRNNKSSFRQQQ